MFEEVTEILGIDPLLLAALGTALYINVQVIKALIPKAADYSLPIASVFATIFAVLVVLEMTQTLQVILLAQLLLVGGAGVYSMKPKEEKVEIEFNDYLDQK